MTEVVGCTADVRFNCDWYFPIRAAWNCFPYSSPSYSWTCKLIGLPMHWQILLQPILDQQWKKWHQDLSVLRPALLIDSGPNFLSAKGQCYSLKIRGCRNSIFPSAVYWISYTFLSGTESLFHQQMKLNPITVKLWNSVDHSNMFSKRALRIKHKRRERMGKKLKIAPKQMKVKTYLGWASVIHRYTIHDIRILVSHVAFNNIIRFCLMTIKWYLFWICLTINSLRDDLQKVLQKVSREPPCRQSFLI